MSLTSYRAAPPRVTRFLPEGKYRRSQTQRVLSRLRHSQAVMHASGANCERRFAPVRDAPSAKLCGTPIFHSAFPAVYNRNGRLQSGPLFRLWAGVRVEKMILVAGLFEGADECCVLQTWQRPTLPRLETKYHWRWGVSRPCSERERVRPPRNNHQVSEAQHFEKLAKSCDFLLSFEHVFQRCAGHFRLTSRKRKARRRSSGALAERQLQRSERRVSAELKHHRPEQGVALSGR